jgi:hypothetical protein
MDRPRNPVWRNNGYINIYIWGVKSLMIFFSERMNEATVAKWAQSCTSESYPGSGVHGKFHTICWRWSGKPWLAYPAYKSPMPPNHICPQAATGIGLATRHILICDCVTSSVLAAAGVTTRMTSVLSLCFHLLVVTLATGVTGRAHARVLDPKPEPSPKVDPKPALQFDPEVDPRPMLNKSDPTPKVDAKPTPQREPKPMPQLDPQPESSPKPEPDPKPQPDPKAQPRPKPVMAPKPIPKPMPELKPQPDPSKPEPQPTSMPELTKPQPDPSKPEPLPLLGN